MLGRLHARPDLADRGNPGAGGAVWAWRAGLAAFLDGSQRFRLARYFTVTSLVAFAIFAAALYHLERSEGIFFEGVHGAQGGFFALAQSNLVSEQRAAALRNLLTAHEAGHITLTTVFANALWESRFAPVVARAQRVPIDHCRGAPTESAREACFTSVGRQIMALPGFAGVDSAVHAMMKKSAVFKIKVYDMRGITVYSSELAQVGEDKAQNRGWKSAIEGRNASELVHRDRFSTFEGEVENRDLIQSYIPVRSRDGAIAGVFEIYSDVTPLLAQIEAFTAQLREVASANEASMRASGIENRRKVESNANQHLVILGGLMILLYLSLLVLVRLGQRVIDGQARAREQAALRERQWHRETMAALATMAASTSHEIGNPLAVISGMAEEIEAEAGADAALAARARAILEQASRIARMTQRITEFATSRGEAPALVDVNGMAEAVGDFIGFDSRYRATRIEMQLADGLPACSGVPDHLNEVLMSLVQAYAEVASRAAGGRVIVRTEARGDEVVIAVGCEGALSGDGCALASGDSRLDSARRLVEAMGGRLVPTATAMQIFLRRAVA